MTGITKRLFLALPLDKENRNLCRGFTGANDHLGIRWIPEENWHITTIFLGDFPETHLEDLKRLLFDNLAGTTPFSIDFDCFCPAPDSRHPRMVWARYYQSRFFDDLMINTYDFLKKFYKSNRLDFGITLHSRNVPHVTLSRFKNIQLPEIRQTKIDLVLPVSSCILFESVLKPQGARYSKITEILFNPFNQSITH